MSDERFERFLVWKARRLNAATQLFETFTTFPAVYAAA